MIAKSTIEAIRARADVVAVIASTVKLTRRGRSFVGLCPFHKERSPSFHVSPEKGFYHCFGCKASGDAFRFLQETEGLTFREAVQRLAEPLGIAIEETGTEQERRQETAERKERDDLFAVMRMAADFYVASLYDHEESHVARSELARRGMNTETTDQAIQGAIGSFMLGYAPSSWDALAQHFKQQGVSPALGEKVGLLVPRQGGGGGGGYYDRFRNRLMFPVLDLQGRVVAFSGRVLPDPETGVVDKETGKYINSPETSIYRKGDVVYGLFQARTTLRLHDGGAVVVEGNFDVVSLHARGMTNVVAPLGTAFTVEQARTVKRFTPEVTIMFDGDAAGMKALRASEDTCRTAGLIARAVILPDKADPDSLAQTDAGMEWVRAAVASAKPIAQRLVELYMVEASRSSDMADRARLFREVGAIIQAADVFERSLLRTYARDLASRFGVRVPVASDRDPAAALTGAAPAKPVLVSSQKAVLDPMIAHVMGACVEHPALVRDEFIGPRLQALVSGDCVFLLAAIHQHGDGFASNIDAIDLPPNVRDLALRRLASPVGLSYEAARSNVWANLDDLEGHLGDQEMEAMQSALGTDEDLGVIAKFPGR